MQRMNIVSGVLIRHKSTNRTGEILEYLSDKDRWRVRVDADDTHSAVTLRLTFSMIERFFVLLIE